MKCTVFLYLLMVSAAWLAGAGPVCAQEPARDNYFYLRHTSAPASQNTCVTAFGALRAGQGEDVGGIIRSLNSINVHYLLDDYDNALTRDRRKQNYLELDALYKEVAANKQEIYCAIELAVYLRNHAEFAGPAYRMLLDEAYRKLDETYAAALLSYAAGDYERARYAFDLIAPYQDAHDRYLATVDKLHGNKDEAITNQDDGSVAASTGPIAAAVMELPAPEETAANAVGEPGPIGLAATPGPVMTAVRAAQ